MTEKERIYNMTEEEIREFFLSIPTGPISDAMELLGMFNWMEGIHPLRPNDKIFGHAFTLKGSPNHGPGFGQKNYHFKELADLWEPGDILVSHGQVGGINALFCKIHKAGGMIVNRSYRDHLEIIEIEDFPVFGRGPEAKLDRTGMLFDEYQVPIEMAGARVCPGDYVFGDRDGVVVIPKARIYDVIYQAKFVIEVEEEILAAVKAGKSGAEVNKIVAKKRKPRD